MEKLIVQNPFEYNGVHYHQGMEFRPKNSQDAEKKEREGAVVRKVFAKPGQSAAPKPAPRKLKTENAEEKLAAQTVEKTEEPKPAEEEKTNEEEEKPAEQTPTRRGRRRTLASKKDD